MAMDFSHSIAVALLLLSTLLSSPHQVVGQQKDATIFSTTHDAVILVGDTEKFTLQLQGNFDQAVNLTLQTTQNGVADIIPNAFEIKPNTNVTRYTGVIFGNSPGRVEIIATAKPSDIINTKNVFFRVVVAYSLELINISSVIGWLYFFAWSISFYPQIYANFKRKSVVGLNFDFVSLNILGFMLYGVFNVGLYFIPEVQAEYQERYPRGVNPVQLNDVFFAVHASIATFITICQCFAFERAEQRVSTIARSILGCMILCVVISLTLSALHYLNWLDFLYICSYVKLSITLIKYIPQAYMNYRRQSTIGWSIGNVLLDFTGGMLSMLQMMLNAYNYDDWQSIFGDPTKFGLGLFSVMFDFLFLFQHYVLYRDRETYTVIDGENNETLTVPETSQMGSESPLVPRDVRS